MRALFVLVLALLGLSLSACATAPTGARYTPPETAALAAQIGSSARAIDRADVRAKRIVQTLSVPLLRPEDQRAAQRDAGDLGEDLAEARAGLVAATSEVETLRTAAAAQTATLNATVAERDSVRAERDSVRASYAALKAQSGWWARLKSNVALFVTAFVLGGLTVFIIRALGGITAILIRAGVRTTTGV